MRHGRRVVPLLALAVAVWGCATTAPVDAGIPSRSADLAGRITLIVPAGNYAGTIRVEADPSSPNTGAKGVVTLTSATTIWAIDRSAGDVRSLATGHWVRIWFTGPVAMIYPVQGAAAAVVVDSLGTSLTK